jgi:NhaA family Na+:H+ antiporter
VHATVAGVLVALTVPHGFPRERRGLLRKLNAILDEGWNLEQKGASVELERRMMAIEEIEEVAEDAASPLMHMEHKLATWVSYGVIPLFALANAGVKIGGGAMAEITGAIPLGIVLGLVIGKQIGIVGFSWLAVRLGWCDLPQGINWKLVHGASALAGIGFTMSIFIATLAFPDPDLIEVAKMGVLVASLFSALLGTGVLLAATRGGADPAGGERG